MASSEPRARVYDQLGRPLGTLRLSVTDRCNLRCGYCMPGERYTWLQRRELLDFDELALVAEAFGRLGVDKIRLTGGEPLLRRELHRLVERLRSLPAIAEVALTTNGLLLSEYAADLRRAGLCRLTVSLDTLRPDRFERLTRYPALGQVLRGIDAAKDAGFDGVKLDTVVIRGVNDDEITALLDYARERQLELRFIEYMDVGGATGWQPELVVSRAELLDTVRRERGEPRALDGRGSAPAERFELDDGTVFGIIASTTAPFCSECDRSRVTADGMWLHCLYARHGYDLKTLLRGGAGVEALAGELGRGWSERADRGAEERARLDRRSTLIPAEALLRSPHLEMHVRGG